MSIDNDKDYQHWNQ